MDNLLTDLSARIWRCHRSRAVGSDIYQRRT